MDSVGQHVPVDAIHKALPGWIVVSRHHMEDIISMPKNHLCGKDLWMAFRDCWAPEEAFFPTALALAGHLSETVPRSLTYAEWNDRARNKQNRAHPLSWDNEFDANLVQSLRSRHDCYFLRKLKHEISVSRWEHATNSKREGLQRRCGTKRPGGEPDQERMKRVRDR